MIATDESVRSEEVRAFVSAAQLDVVGESTRWEDIRELAESRAADLVFVAGTPEFARGKALLPSSLPALLLVADDSRAAEYASVPAYALVPCRATPAWVAASAALAAGRAAELAAAAGEAAALKDQLETRKVVERAKGVLMKRLRLEEDEAYRRLQKASQDENRKLREIAESVLRAEKVFGLTALGDRAAEHEAPERERAG